MNNSAKLIVALVALVSCMTACKKPKPITTKNTTIKKVEPKRNSSKKVVKKVKLDLSSPKLLCELLYAQLFLAIKKF